MGSAPTIEPSDARAWTLSDVFAAWAADRERLCDNLEELLAKAEREPLGVDISDFSDEFCAGFLRGQLNVLELLLRDPPLPDRRGAQAEPSTAPEPTHGRHCSCSSCAREDWAQPHLAPCGMHGRDCPPVYAPIVGRRPERSSEKNTARDALRGEHAA